MFESVLDRVIHLVNKDVIAKVEGKKETKRYKKKIMREKESIV